MFCFLIKLYVQSIFNLGNACHFYLDKMCKVLIIKCHCCENTPIDVNVWKCFYSIDDYRYYQEKYNNNHKVENESIKSLFEMCPTCKLKCSEKCLNRNKSTSYKYEIFYPSIKVYKETTINSFISCLKNICRICKRV